MADRKVKWSGEFDIDEMLKSVKSMADAYAAATAKMEASGEGVGDALADAVEGGAERAEKSVAESSSRMSDVLKGSFLGSFAGNIAAKGLDMLASGIGSVADAMIGGNAEMETYRASFETLLGSTDRANKLLGELAELGAATPFEFPELAAAGRNLVAFGTEADRVPELLRRIGDVSSGVNANVGEMSELFGKAKVAGTLYAEDINQLLGRGVPILDEFSKILGKSAIEVKKMASEGKIGYDLLEQALVNMTDEGGKFAGMMEKQSATFSGMTSTMQDVLAEAGRTIGAPLFEKAKEGLGRVLEILQDPATQEAVAGFAEGLGDVMELLIDNKEVIGAIVGGLVAYQGAQKLAGVELGKFTSMLKTNPYVILATGLAAAIVALKDYQKESQQAARNTLKEVDAQIELNKRAQETTRAKQDQLQKNLGLMETYEQLGQKVGRTKEEEDQYRDALRQLQEQYPGVISAGNSFDQNLAAIRDRANETKAQIAGLSVELDKMSKRSRELIMERADTAVEAETEKLLDSIRDKYSTTILGLNVTDEEYLSKVRTRAVSMIERAQTESEALDAVLKTEEKLKQIFKSYDIVPKASEMQAFSAQLDVIAQKQIEYLKLTSKGGITDTPDASTAGDQPPAPPQAPDDKAKKEAERKAREAYQSEIAALARQQAIDEQKAKNEEASEQRLFSIWESYQIRRLAAAERYGQESADLQNALDVKRIEMEGIVAKEKADLAEAYEEAQQETLERLEEETEAAIERVDELTESIDVVGKFEREQDAIRASADARRQAVTDTLSNLATATQEFFEINKGISIAQATVNTYEGATKALAAYPPPFGAIAMAAVIAAGLAQVAQIVAQKPTAMAEGGILDRPTFVAGEAGAEVVAPLKALPGLLADSLALAVGRTEKRRTRIREKSGTRVDVGISSRIVGRGSRASQVSKTIGVL